MNREELFHLGWNKLVEADDSIVCTKNNYDLFYDFYSKKMQIMKNWRNVKETLFFGKCPTVNDYEIIINYLEI